MGTEQNDDGSLIYVKRDVRGRPIFGSEEVTDPTTGVIRRSEKSILPSGFTTIREQDTFPALGIVRISERNFHLPGQDLHSQALAERLVEKIRITKIGGITSMFWILSTRYTKAQEMEHGIESLSFSKVIWNGLNCGASYRGDGKISNIFITSDLDVVKDGKELEKLDWVEISFRKDGLVIDENQPTSFVPPVIPGMTDTKFVFSKLFRSKDYIFELEDLGDSALLCIEPKKPKAGKKRTKIHATKSINDVGKLYSIVSTEAFAGWEKVLEKTNAYFFLDG